jgi:hypothetical protein
MERLLKNGAIRDGGERCTKPTEKQNFSMFGRGQRGIICPSGTNAMTLGENP